MDRRYRRKGSMTAEETARFDAARALAEAENKGEGIGTLGEKSIHKTLKYFIDPDSSHHEISVKGFVADVKNGDGIFEIQTRAFHRLLPKLSAFLSSSPVTLVLPIITDKTVLWIEPNSGELAERKKSPKHAKPVDSFAELSALSGVFPNDSLTVKIILLTATEYRILDGSGAARHKRATKLDIIPEKILDIFTVKTAKDLRALLPKDMPEIFDTKMLFGKINKRKIYSALKFVLDLKIIEYVGKKGNTKLYSFTQ